MSAVEQAREAREKALPNALAKLVDAHYFQVWRSVYRDDFWSLLSEAHRTFVEGCPRASIIVSGEALFRAILVRIETELLQKQHWIDSKRSRLGTGAMVTGDQHDAAVDPAFFNFRRGKKNESIILAKIKNPEKLNFCDGIDLLEQNALVSSALGDQLFVVKELRNCAVHRKLPFVETWNPDVSQSFTSDEERRQWLFGKIQVPAPECYRFESKSRTTSKETAWFSFDLRKYTCNSLVNLGLDERLAAMQYCMATDAIFRLGLNWIQLGDRVRDKTSNRQGTVAGDKLARAFVWIIWDGMSGEERVHRTLVERIQ